MMSSGGHMADDEAAAPMLSGLRGGLSHLTLEGRHGPRPSGDGLGRRAQPGHLFTHPRSAAKPPPSASQARWVLCWDRSLPLPPHTHTRT